MRIRYCLEKALYLAQSGRPGPAWLDIPLNVQGAYVDSDELIGFDPADYEAGGTGWALAEGQIKSLFQAKRIRMGSTTISLYFVIQSMALVISNS